MASETDKTLDELKDEFYAAQREASAERRLTAQAGLERWRAKQAEDTIYAQLEERRAQALAALYADLKAKDDAKLGFARDEREEQVRHRERCKRAATILARRNETALQRQERLEWNRNYMRMKRANSSKALLRDKAAAQRKANRAAETTEQAAQRRAEHAAYRKARRAELKAKLDALCE